MVKHLCCYSTPLFIYNHPIKAMTVQRSENKTIDQYLKLFIMHRSLLFIIRGYQKKTEKSSLKNNFRSKVFTLHWPKLLGVPVFQLPLFIIWVFFYWSGRYWFFCYPTMFFFSPSRQFSFGLKVFWYFKLLFKSFLSTLKGLVWRN